MFVVKFTFIKILRRRSLSPYQNEVHQALDSNVALEIY